MTIISHLTDGAAEPLLALEADGQPGLRLLGLALVTPRSLHSPGVTSHGGHGGQGPHLAPGHGLAPPHLHGDHATAGHLEDQPRPAENQGHGLLVCGRGQRDPAYLGDLVPGLEAVQVSLAPNLDLAHVDPDLMLHPAADGEPEPGVVGLHQGDLVSFNLRHPVLVWWGEASHTLCRYIASKGS